MSEREIVGWLVEPLDDRGAVIEWIAGFPKFVSILDAPAGPPKYGPQFRLTALARAEPQEEA